MKTFNYKELVLNYVDDESSSENAVIFIHGNSHSHRTFRNQLSDKRFSNFRLIAIDLPGHGNSAHTDDYNVSLFAGALETLITTLALKSYVLVGHSLGGHVAIQSLSQLSPKGIVIFGTPPLLNPPDFTAFKNHPNLPLLFKNELSISEVEALVKSFYEKHEVTVADIEELLKTDHKFRESMAKSVAELRFSDEVALLNDFEGHKMILHAQNDPFINKDYMETYIDVSSLWNDSICVLESSHNMHVESPEEFNQLLLPFLQASFSVPAPSTHLDAVTMKLL